MSDSFGSGPFGAGKAPSAIEAGSHATAALSESGAPLDLIQVSGRIKWFDVAKGFGFIVPDSGPPDVLLHATCLRRDGYQAAHEGAQITVDAARRARGLQALRIVSLDNSTAIHPSELPL